MKRLPILSFAALLVAGFGLANTVLAAPGGAIGTMPLGHYTCETPGDAAGPTGLLVPEADFRVINASSYATPKGQGTYLLTGERLTMTGGPLRGLRFHRVSSTFLARIEADGSENKLRCIRGVNYRL